MTSVTPDSIFQVASGFMASKHLYVANEVGLFEHEWSHTRRPAPVPALLESR